MKNHVVMLKLTDNELNSIKNETKRLHISINDTIRIILFGYTLTPRAINLGKYHPKKEWILDKSCDLPNVLDSITPMSTSQLLSTMKFNLLPTSLLNNSGSITPTGISPIATTSTFQIQPQIQLQSQPNQSYPPITDDMDICTTTCAETLQLLGIDTPIEIWMDEGVVVRTADSFADEVIVTDYLSSFGGLKIMTRSEWEGYKEGECKNGD